MTQGFHKDVFELDEARTGEILVVFFASRETS